MRWIHLTSIVILFLLLPHCQKSQECRLSAEQEALAQVYAELFRLQGRHAPEHPVYLDSARIILESHHLTKETFDERIAYLNDRPRCWETFYEEVLQRLKDDGRADSLRALGMKRPFQRTLSNKSEEAAPR